MIGGTVNLELALQDAVMATQECKDWPGGYLELGKILQLLDQDKSALNICAEGVEQADPDHENFKV